MKNVEINIVELGPVRNCKIRLAPMMLFTGASSLGKSYVNFLCYYTFGVLTSGRLNDFIRRKISVDIEKSKSFSFTIKSSELRLYIEKDVKAFFQYLLNYKNISCQIQFLFPDVLDKYEFQYKEVDKAEDHGTSDMDFGHLTCNREVVGNILLVDGFKSFSILRGVETTLHKYLLGEDAPLNSILFPPGRASLLTGDFSTQENSSRIGLYDLFLRDNDRINRRALRRPIDKTNIFFINQIRKLIGGDIQVDRDGLQFVTNEGISMPIDAAASSIKELSPLLMLIRGGNINRYSICIEEPEAHLHPTMQISVANLLAACINKGVFMQITTHSDYFVQRINQLLRLGKMRQNDEGGFNAFCKRESLDTRYFIDSNLLQAYFFTRNNGVTEVSPLLIEGDTIPMSTFVSAVETLSQQDEMIDKEMNKE